MHANCLPAIKLMYVLLQLAEAGNRINGNNRSEQPNQRMEKTDKVSS